ncbi:hypothetical protein NDU88_008518 [Pleurodeles waltl]|uniref:Uncharacterized protein n=1 Tax=Pleurodeles waltl TaxID=8319 RepID=A0AAV7RVY8_PLEWA|nr:hypothetical protein NDU88_008518 [Pleurodeles waltl]
MYTAPLAQRSKRCGGCREPHKDSVYYFAPRIQKYFLGECESSGTLLLRYFMLRTLLPFIHRRPLWVLGSILSSADGSDLQDLTSQRLRDEYRLILGPFGMTQVYLGPCLRPRRVESRRVWMDQTGGQEIGDSP